jgi:hypothetical protein
MRQSQTFINNHSSLIIYMAPPAWTLDAVNGTNGRPVCFFLAAVDAFIVTHRQITAFFI